MINPKFSPVSLLIVSSNSTGRAADVEQVFGEAVSGNYFELFGGQGGEGRTFSPEEIKPLYSSGGRFSHGLWQRRFGANSAVVGPTITLNLSHSLSLDRTAAIHRQIEAWRSEVWVPLMMIPHWAQYGLAR